MKKKKSLAFINLLLVLALVLTIVPCRVTEAATVKLNKSIVQLNPKKSYTLKLSGTKKKAKWYSSDPRVVGVNSRGKITAKKTGTAVVKAKIGSKKYSCKVLVVPKNRIISASTDNKNKKYTFLGKIYKTNWTHPMMGKQTAYIMRLVKPIRYTSNYHYGVETISEVQLRSAVGYDLHLSRNVGIYICQRIHSASPNAMGSEKSGSLWK